MDPGDPAELEDYLQLAISFLSLVIFAVAALAYRRRPTTRTLLVTAAFGVYVLRSLFMVADFVLEEGIIDTLESAAIVLEAIFLGLIVTAFLKS